MDSFRYLYGPVPSRRLGASLGVSPIPPKTCNYSCIYCQLGRTSRIQTHREIFFPVEDILVELDRYLEKAPVPDAVTVPRAAVRDNGVWLVGQDGRVTRRPVETGVQTRESTEIRSGVQSGDRVVVEGGALLSEGAQVRIVGAAQE